MNVYRSMAELERAPRGCVLTIGNFDGVHAGHREILTVARDTAERLGTGTAVMTFEPHPVAILYPDKARGMLTPLGLKLPLLSRYADNCVIVLEDSKALLGLSAEAFVDQFLMRTLCPCVIVEGDDFHFGAGRSGNVEVLRCLGREKGFDVVVVPPRQITLSTGQVLRVSSTMVRYMLEGGHVADAAVALERPYRLFGRVVSGRGKGRELGYPTLNMDRPDQVLPAEGVYAGYVRLLDEERPGRVDGRVATPAVFSLGQARTFGDDFPLLIEAHLLTRPGLNPHPQGQWMAMDFVRRLRSQHKFSSVEHLVGQIQEDCRRARGILQDPGSLRFGEGTEAGFFQ